MQPNPGLRRLRSLLFLAAFAGAASALAKMLKANRRPDTSAAPSTMIDLSERDHAAEPARSVSGTVKVPAAKPSPAERNARPISGKTWSEPLDGRCPPGFPVKVKLSSGIFHVEGGLAYDRTHPDRCYPTPEAAQADGFRGTRR